MNEDLVKLGKSEVEYKHEYEDKVTHSITVNIYAYSNSIQIDVKGDLNTIARGIVSLILTNKEFEDYALEICHIYNELKQ